MNSHIAELSGEGLRLGLAEAFPNCPNCIHRRELSPRLGAAVPAYTEQGDILNDELVSGISTADTFFVASSHPNGRVDVSHRGGNPGFVWLQDVTLRIPDCPGNSMFRALGNFAVNPNSGVGFVDFQRGRQLQLTGDVPPGPLAIHADRDAVLDEHAGEGRARELRALSVLKISGLP